MEAPMPNHVLIATLKARAGSEAELGGILRGLLEPSRREAGCLRYDLHRDPADPATFVFLETWVNREAHQAHCATSHFLEARRRQEGLVAAREVKVLEQVD
jgi:quinol monooxygenase YgiN